MTGGRVLVVDDEADRITEHLRGRGLEVDAATDLRTGLSARDVDSCCVVAGQLQGHTVAELVSRLGQQTLPVVFVYDDDAAATTALDAGAAATIERRDLDASWGSHLAATVDSIRRRETTAREESPLLSGALDELPDLFFVVRVDGTFLRWNRKLREVSGYTDEEIGGMGPTDFFEGEDARRIENAIGRVVMNGRATEVATLVTSDGREIPHEFTGALVDANGTQAIVGTGRDIRERRERERELEAQTERLESLNRANAVIRDVTGGLIETETREEIERTVCENLTDAEAYRFAWIGTYTAEGDRIEPRAWAGEGEGYLTDRPAESADDETVTALEAVRQREVVFAQNVDDDPEAGGWRAAALEHGHESAAAIPIVYGDTTYGCLCLYADRPEAFGPLEREVLAELGETIGHAIDAAETRRALAADTVTELQLRVTDEDAFLVQAASRTDAELELVGSVPQPDGAIIQLFTVRGVDTETVQRLGEVAPVPVEVVTRRDDECIVKIRVEDESIAHALAEVGGTVRTVTVGDGDVRVRVDVPRDVSVKEVLKRVRAVYQVQLLSQREVERDEVTDVDFRAGVERHLTDRQLEVLQTAFRSGFFAWPRERTGEEIAEVLEVSPPTFHQHLRVAERKLLEVLFDGASPTAVTSQPQANGQPSPDTNGESGGGS